MFRKGADQKHWIKCTVAVCTSHDIDIFCDDSILLPLRHLKCERTFLWQEKKEKTKFDSQINELTIRAAIIFHVNTSQKSCRPSVQFCIHFGISVCFLFSNISSNNNNEFIECDFNAFAWSAIVCQYSRYVFPSPLIRSQHKIQTGQPFGYAEHTDRWEFFGAIWTVVAAEPIPKTHINPFVVRIKAYRDN